MQGLKTGHPPHPGKVTCRVRGLAHSEQQAWGSGDRRAGLVSLYPFSVPSGVSHTERGPEEGSRVWGDPSPHARRLKELAKIRNLELRVPAPV